MHELSIAQSLVDVAVRSLASLSIERVVRVRVAVGAWSGIAPEALLLAYDVAAEGTPLAGSTLEIREVPAVVHCPRCARDMPIDPDRWLCCPACGTPTADLRHGRELDLESIEVETRDS